MEESLLSILDPLSIRWAVGLIIAFPILIIALSELIRRMERAKRPIASTLRIVRNLVLPAVAVDLLLSRVIELDPTSLPIKIARTIFWIFFIHASLSFVNDVIFASAEEGSWQARVPKLLLDLARTVLVLIGGAIVLSTVWEADLANLATALGVGSIVIGLALQEPMGNLFAGLVLLFERPLSLGDWITVEGVTGRVVEINWRSVHVETTTHEVRIVPNSALYKGSFSNLSRPTALRTEEVELGFSYDDPPNKVKKVLLDTLRETEGVLRVPSPVVRTVEYDDFAINYRVIFSVSSQGVLPAIRDDFMTRVWYSAGRHGLTIPYPTQTEISQEQKDYDVERAMRPAALLRSFPQFAIKDETGEKEIESRVAIRQFAQGERIVAEGQPLGGLHLILEGKARLTVADRSGNEQEIAIVGKGEYFGEQAILSSQSSEITVTALEDLKVLILDPEGLNLLLERMPRLAREIGGQMDIRRKSAQLARKVGS